MHHTPDNLNQKHNITIIYDGDCPVCKAYIRYTRLKKNLSPLLIDARQRPDLVAELGQKAINIDTGMVVIFSSRYYHGADAMHLLSGFTTVSGVVNRLNILLFSNSAFADFIYPLLRASRNLLLFILGRKPIRSGR